MPIWMELIVFAVSITAMFWGSARLTASLERIGSWLQLSEGLLGIVTALGADSPEICSAIMALLAKQHEVGVGVVLGSNIGWSA